MTPYWIDALFARNNTIIEGYYGNDGLLVKISINDALPLLKELKCPSDNDGWFFNNTKDRYIAEKESTYIIANPQLLYQTNYTIIT